MSSIGRLLYTLFWLLAIPFLAFAAINLSTLNEGDVILQKDLDAADVSKIEIPLGSPAVNIDRTRGEIELTFTATTLQKTVDGGIVIQEPLSVTYELSHYADCRREGQTKAECVTFIRNVLLGLVEEGKQIYRTQFEGMQTAVDYTSELTAGDLNITVADLTAVP